MYDFLSRVEWAVVIPIYIILILTAQIRYGLMAGLVYFVSSIWKREAWFRFRVYQTYAKKAQIKSEIKWSLVTGVIFSTMEMGVIVCNYLGITQIYTDFSEYGIFYFIFSVIAMIVLHDAYFYWTHRLLHWKPLYKIHKIHHDSVVTTAFTSFNFHPIEAVVQFSILPILMFLFPVHWLSITLFLFYMVIFNLSVHNSYEFYPKGMVRNKVFGQLSTPTHHSLHHKRVNCNYGLYFTYWDRLFGTLHPEYEEIFESVKDRAEEIKLSMDQPQKEAMS